MMNGRKESTDQKTLMKKFLLDLKLLHFIQHEELFLKTCA